MIKAIAVISQLALIATFIFIVLDLRSRRRRHQSQSPATPPSSDERFLNEFINREFLTQAGGLTAILFKASEARPGDVIMKLWVDVTVTDDFVKSDNPSTFIQHAIERFRMLGWSFTTNFVHNYTLVYRPGAELPVGLINRHAA